jgi:riboflavin biosynthesis pyrimidine reductase
MTGSSASSHLNRIPMEPIRTLFPSESSSASSALPDGLRTQYGGDLSFPPVPDDRPYVFGNFVSTLDGVVTFNLPGQSEGTQISGSNEGDAFVMGLLRASADAVIVGSDSLGVAGPKATWLPEGIYAPAKDLYDHYREDVLKKSPPPLTVIVTGSGALDLSAAAFHTPGANALIATTPQGRQRLEQGGSLALASVQVRVVSRRERVAPSAILEVLKQEFGAAHVLHEGGPTLFGESLGAGLVDEVFLTMAPQVAGRTPPQRRLGFAESFAFDPASAPWWKLITAKNAGDHLYLRYRRKPTNP